MQIKPLQVPLAHRNRDVKPSLIVLHATAGATASSSINHLRGVGLSYHYIIARDGKDSAKSDSADGSDPVIFHCVPDNKHAFHVGSTIPAPSGSGSIAKNSIGVSLANIQRRNNPEAYPKAQLKALNELIAHLVSTMPTITRLTTHAVVQPWNRSDPLLVDGPSLAAAHGLTFWTPTAQQIKDHTPPKKP